VEIYVPDYVTVFYVLLEHDQILQYEIFVYVIAANTAILLSYLAGLGGIEVSIRGFKHGREQGILTL
jgi:hypothetical protein